MECVQNVKVLNSPARVYSVSNPAQLTMSKLTIDNCACSFIATNPWYFGSALNDLMFVYLAAGDNPNSQSGGKAAGHNTDGFDCSTTNLIIEDR